MIQYWTQEIQNCLDLGIHSRSSPDFLPNVIQSSNSSITFNLHSFLVPFSFHIILNLQQKKNLPFHHPFSQKKIKKRSPPMAAPTGMDNPKVKMAGTNPSAAPTAEPAARPVAPPVAPKAAAPPATPAQVAWTWPSWPFKKNNGGKMVGSNTNLKQKIKIRI